MKRRTPTHGSEPKLSENANFYLKSAAMTGVLALGIGALASHESSSDENTATHESASAYAMVTARQTNTAEFKDGDGIGTAQNLIEYIVEQAVSNFSVSATPNDNHNAVHMPEELATFDQAQDALKMAGYGDILPDDGDMLEITADVSVDSEGEVSYEIVDAEIVDRINNQD